MTNKLMSKNSHLVFHLKYTGRNVENVSSEYKWNALFTLSPHYHNIGLGLISNFTV